MATVREIQASFIAKAGSMKSSIQDMKKEVGGLKKTTENSTKGMSSSWTTMGNKLETSGQKITTMGKTVGAFGRKWTKMTAVVGGAALGVGTAIFGLTNKVTKNAEELAIAADQMGVTTGFYQEMEYWADENGLSQEQMEKAVGRLNQRMGEAAKGNEKYAGALEALGINMDDVRDGTVSTEDAFIQSISSLSEMENGQEQAALATELFGTRMARQLLPALKDGSLSIDDARKKAQELGLVMSEDQIEASEKFQAAYREIKRSIGVAFREMAINALPTFQKFADWTLEKMPEIQEKMTSAFDKAAGGIRNVWNWFNNLSPEMKKATGLFAGVAAAIGPVSMGISAAMKVFGPFTTVVGKAFKAIGKFGGLLPVIKAGLAALTGPVGIVVASIAALTAGFVTAYNKSETFRNIVHKLKDAFLNAVSGIKEFLTTNPQIQSMLDAMKSGFRIMKDVVSQAVRAVANFFQEKIAQMKSFWDSEGQDFLQAFKNIFNAIWTVVGPVIDKIVSLVKTSLPIISTVFKTTFGLVLDIVKSVWGNIKGIIDGGLQAIMGLIKTFSGLFTGDFSKMWEGIKEIFSGAIKILWNWVQLNLFGKLTRLLGKFVGPFKQTFSVMWNGIQKVFSKVIGAIVKFVRNRFNNMKTVVTTIMSGINKVIDTIWNAILSFFSKILSSIFNVVKRVFNNVKNTVTTVTTAIKNTISNIWNAVFGFFKKILSNIFNNVKSRFNSIKNTVSQITTSVKNAISNIWNSIFNFFKKILTNIFNNVKNRFTNMKNTVTSITTGIKNITSKIWNSIKSTLQTIIKSIVNFGKNWFNTFKNNLNTVFNSIKNITKNAWNTVKRFIVDPIKSGVNWAIKKFTGFKNSVTDTFKNIKDNVFGYVSDMITKIKNMPGNMKKKLKSNAGKLFDGMKNIGQKMVDGIAKGVNGVIKGVNWVLNKFGVDTKGKNNGDGINYWTPSLYAKGTRGKHPKDGPAVVGDGTGSNAGSELMQDPKGNFSLSPDKPTLIPNMPKGTQVWSATDTREALSTPQYAWGINLKDTAKALNLGGKGMQSIGEKEGSKAKQTFGRAAEISGSAIDVYADAPKKIMNAALKKMGVGIPKGEKAMGQIFKSGFNYVKDKAVGFIGDKQEEYAPVGDIDFGGAFTKSSGYGDRPGGFHKGIDFAAETGTPIPAQTGGKVIFSGQTGYGSGLTNIAHIAC